MTETLLVDIKKACQMISVSRSKLYDLHEHCQSFPPFVKIGKKTLINASKLAQWVENIGG